MRLKHKLETTGIIVLLLLVFLAGCNSEEDKASNGPLLDANSSEELDLLLEWHKAYIYPDEFGYDRTAQEALSSLYGNEKYSVEIITDNEALVHYSATGIINDKEESISYDLMWDTQTNSVMPIKMTVNGVEMASRFMEGYIYICEGYETLGNELIQEAANGNTNSYWQEMNEFEQSVHDDALELDRELEDFIDEANQYSNSGQDEGDATATSILSEVYTGNINSCNMSPEQAQAFAALIEGESRQYPVVMAALFDGGDGIPLLWLAHGNDGTWDGNWEYGFSYRIENNYQDQIYAYNNGMIEKCPWMTKVLKTGTDGIVIQISLDKDSELGTHFKMYRLNNGGISPYYFASGAYDPVGNAVLNGQTVETGGQFLDEIDLYRMVDTGIDDLLSATTGSAGMLVLSGAGNWIEGATMSSALTEYATVLQESD